MVAAEPQEVAGWGRGQEGTALEKETAVDAGLAVAVSVSRLSSEKRASRRLLRLSRRAVTKFGALDHCVITV